jgi:lycopene cyclase domain-containing protein
MFDYFLLNLFFLAMILALPLTWRHDIAASNRWAVLLIMLALTAIFDPIIIGLDIVRYHEDAISGLKWFGAPIEDFAYAIIAAIFIPAIWRNLLHQKKHSKKKPHET